MKYTICNPSHSSTVPKMSIQSRSIGKTDYLPLSQIRRPIQPVLDLQKIDAMSSTLNGVPMASSTCLLEDAVRLGGELPPVDVLHVRHNGSSYYFAFGGCHRFQAYEKTRSNSQEPMVKCKILPATKSQLRLYMGATVDSILN